MLGVFAYTPTEIRNIFDLHMVFDEIHGERGYQIVLEHANTAEQEAFF